MCSGLLLAALPARAAPFAYAANNNSVSSSVWVIDTATAPDTVVDKIAVDNGVVIVAVAPDGKRVYVTNSTGVVVIDTTTNTVVDKIAVNNGAGDVAVSPDGKHIYVTNSTGVVVIDTTTNTVIDTITMDDSPRNIAVTPDGKRIYVSNCVDVLVIDTAFNDIVDEIPVTSYGTSCPTDIAVAPDGKRVYVPINGTTFTSDSILVIDTSANSVMDIIAMETGPFKILRHGLVVAPDGKHLYVDAKDTSSRGSGGSIFVIDTMSPNTIVAEVGFGNGTPTDIAVTPDGKRVYVSAFPGFNPLTGGVYVIDTTKNSVVDTIAKGANDFVSVAITTVPASKDQCKNGGWKLFGFKNQGQCIQYVNEGGHKYRHEK
ncbi:MAG: YncE family protein [Methylobacter sp.]